MLFLELILRYGVKFVQQVIGALQGLYYESYTDTTSLTHASSDRKFNHVSALVVLHFELQNPIAFQICSFCCLNVKYIHSAS